MKKLIIFLVLVLVSLSSFSKNYDKNFLKNFQESVELNKNRFKDVNLVYPGDTVLVVKREIVHVIIKEEDLMSKIHDCIWYAVMRTSNSSLNVNNNQSISKTTNADDNNFLKSLKENLELVFIIFMFTLLLIILIIVLFRRPIIINNHFTGLVGNSDQTPTPSPGSSAPSVPVT